ncbi:uncharacterized protein LOC143449806 [Clavelina lepadiformis]|uniref:uncharacterized protein LOC143449806 n=1 Tax=Clavelina lepadiformis TaxID=159417 RepID=UPI0040424992
MSSLHDSHKNADEIWASSLPKDGTEVDRQMNCKNERHPQKRRNKMTAHGNAARERSRVKTLRSAYTELQKKLPSIPTDTKLSKLDILLLATAYIGQLTRSLGETRKANDTATILQKNVNKAKWNAHYHASGYFHPVKKWPMRSTYCTNRIVQNEMATVLKKVTSCDLTKKYHLTADSKQNCGNYKATHQEHHSSYSFFKHYDSTSFLSHDHVKVFSTENLW